MKFSIYLLFGSGLIFSISYGITTYINSKDSASEALTYDDKSISVVKTGRKIASYDSTNLPLQQGVKAILNLRNSQFYTDIKNSLGENHSEYLYDIVAYMKLNSHNEELLAQLEQQFLKDLKHAPKKLFESLMKGIETLDDSPIDQANLFEKLASISGMEEEAKDALMENLTSKEIETKEERHDFDSVDEENKYNEPTNDEIAFDIKLKALEKVTLDANEAYENTVELFNGQTNVNVQKNIAHTYLESNQGNINNFIQEIGINKANELLPENYEVKENDDGTLEYWDHIDPVRGNYQSSNETK